MDSFSDVESRTRMSIAEKRAFQQICDRDGNILVIALDQRNAMRELLSDKAEVRAQISSADLGRVKANLVQHLGNHAPAVLLDPECAFPLLIEAGILARDVGLVIGMDASGWDTKPNSSLRYSRLIPGIRAKTIRQLGGTAAKIMVFMRPDQEDRDRHARDILAKCITDCEAEELLLVVEILAYKLADESPEEYETKKPQLILDSAVAAKEMGAKVLKLQYPGSAESCGLITEALDGTPWALLSAGADHETFLEQLRVSLQSGAAGAIAGRALWKDCLSLDPRIQQARLETLAVPRLNEIQKVMQSSAGKL